MYKVGLSARIVSASEDGLGDQDDASKQGRSIADIDQDKWTTLIDDTQGRINEEDLFGVHDLSGEEVFIDVIAGKNVKQDATVAEKKFSTADPVTTAGEVFTAAEKEFSIVDPVTTASEVFTSAEDIKVAITATITQISKDELTLAQILMEIKAAKPKAKGAKDKGKGIMVELEKPLKMKDQITLDEEVARKLEADMKAEMEEEERIAREKVEANIAMIVK
nr:hypothetical protein [Tanacetum cinerariifolium]